MRRASLCALTALAGLALAGCGIELPSPPTARTATHAAAASTPTVVDNEVPTPPAPSERAGGSATPEAAVAAFARAYINWNAINVAGRLDALARRSVGQARSELRLEAAETRADTELHRGGIANHGSVEAVSRQRAGAEAGRFVVVTRERTTASASTAYEGLEPVWHVALATVRATDHGRRWVVSGWRPES